MEVLRLLKDGFFCPDRNLCDDMITLEKLINDEDYSSKIEEAYDAFSSLNISSNLLYLKYKPVVCEFQNFEFQELLSYSRLKNKEYYELVNKCLDSDIHKRKMEKQKTQQKI